MKEFEYKEFVIKAQKIKEESTELLCELKKKHISETLKKYTKSPEQPERMHVDYSTEEVVHCIMYKCPNKCGNTFVFPQNTCSNWKCGVKLYWPSRGES